MITGMCSSLLVQIMNLASLETSATHAEEEEERQAAEVSTAVTSVAMAAVVTDRCALSNPSPPRLRSRAR